MPLESMYPDDEVMNKINSVPALTEWEGSFAKADTSLEPEFADWDITLIDGLE